LRSFVEVAPESHFPIQNLPYGVFSTRADPLRRVGVALGDRIVDLAVLEEARLLPVVPGSRGDECVFNTAGLNAFLRCGRTHWNIVRARLTELLRADHADLRDDAEMRARAIVPLADATLYLPFEIPGYTDFYSSKEHATNVGSMFRDPKNALLPNWSEIPIGYNGRASSAVVSGTPVRRPNGQSKTPGDARPRFGACCKLDIELETGFVVGTGNALGTPIPIDEAERHIFGMVLLNDWSARDFQQWEAVPLGPFNSKSFSTSISPWVVPLEALEPFRVPGPPQEPTPLPYLQQRGDRGFDIELEVQLRPSGAPAATVIARSNFKQLYWSMAQQLAHHTVSGCNTRPGDLMGSGTISGSAPDSFGSLLERTLNGKNPLMLPGGVTRAFLEDGDEVALSGWCQADGYRIGFGEVSGRILPAHAVDATYELIRGSA
jgi:fumarylacetoacetase